MSDINNGGPAFPRAGDFNPQKGMFAYKIADAMLEARK